MDYKNVLYIIIKFSATIFLFVLFLQEYYADIVYLMIGQIRPTYLTSLNGIEKMAVIPFKVLYILNHLFFIISSYITATFVLLSPLVLGFLLAVKKYKGFARSSASIGVTFIVYALMRFSALNAHTVLESTANVLVFEIFIFPPLLIGMFYFFDRMHRIGQEQVENNDQSI